MFSVSTLKLKESYCIWVFLADENSHKKALKILFQQNFRIHTFNYSKFFYRSTLPPRKSIYEPKLGLVYTRIFFCQIAFVILHTWEVCCMLGMLNEFYNTSYKPISRGKDFQPHTIVKKKPRVPKITYCVAIWGKSSIDIEHGLKGNLAKTPRCLKFVR